MSLLKRTLSILLILCLTLSGGAFALPEAEEAAPRYLVGLKSPLNAVVPYSMQETLTAVDHQGTVYATSDPEMLTALAGSDQIAYIEPDREVCALGLTNDKYSDRLWHLDFLQADAAWDLGLDGSGVRIGVLDSGLNPEHEDFEGVDILEGRNYCGGTDTADSQGHGTFVSGIIAAKRNNSIGVAGLTDGVTLVPLKVMSQRTGTTSAVISAIYDAVDVYHCDVLNMSFGSVAFSQAEANAIAYAVSKGVLIVTAVGNDGNSVSNYPAALPDTVGVGFIDSLGIISESSQRNESVDVVAPGVDLASTYVADLENSSAYAKGSGSSFSSPVVAALAVMAKQVWPEIRQEDFTKLITETARDAGAPGYDTSYGYGIVNLPAFLEALTDTAEQEALLSQFSDVASHWARSSIGRALQAELMNGTGASAFSPEATTTRYMAVTTLARLSGEDLNGYTDPFEDVPSGQWYSAPVAWAASNKIVNGMSPTRFAGEDFLTREQLAAMLYRYAAYTGADLTAEDHLSSFSDGGTVSGWAATAMNWCVDRGILQGSGGKLSPGGYATRAHLATMLMRLHDLLS